MFIAAIIILINKLIETDRPFGIRAVVYNKIAMIILISNGLPNAIVAVMGAVCYTTVLRRSLAFCSIQQTRYLLIYLFSTIE